LIIAIERPGVTPDTMSVDFDLGPEGGNHARAVLGDRSEGSALV
jgi:hypothetical protein